MVLESGRVDTHNQNIIIKEMLNINHIGEKYGIYTIVGVSDEKSNDGHKMYIAKCECGECKTFRYSKISHNIVYKCPHWLVYGDIKIKSNQIDDKRLAHIFHGILRRCYVPDSKDYKFYGAKGIRVCQEWIDNPRLFEIWALHNNYKSNLTIDRVEDNKNYTPDNCRWIDVETNTRFKSTTNYITATVTLSGRQWASLIPDIGTNYINRLVKNQGEKVAIEFIEDKLKNKYNLACHSKTPPKMP